MGNGKSLLAVISICLVIIGLFANLAYRVFDTTSNVSTRQITQIVVKTDKLEERLSVIAIDIALLKRDIKFMKSRLEDFDSNKDF